MVQIVMFALLFAATNKWDKKMGKNYDLFYKLWSFNAWNACMFGKDSILKLSKWSAPDGYKQNKKVNSNINKTKVNEHRKHS